MKMFQQLKSWATEFFKSNITKELERIEKERPYLIQQHVDRQRHYKKMISTMSEKQLLAEICYLLKFKD